MRQDAIRPSLVSVCRLLADSDNETVTASLHVLMCHAVLQLRAAGRHPPQSGVRLSPAGGRRQRDRHRVSTCPDVSRRVTAACGRTPSAPVWCPSVACWRTATPSPRLYETVTASLHVLMCHAVLQLRAAGRHPPQSGVRLSPSDSERASLYMLM